MNWLEIFSNLLKNSDDTNLFEREGKALTNFKYTLPAVTSDLEQEMTRDPYNFGFAKLTFFSTTSLSGAMS